MTTAELLSKYSDVNIFSLSCYIKEEKCSKETVLSLNKKRYQKKIDHFKNELNLNDDEIQYINSLIGENKSTKEIINKSKEIRNELKKKYGESYHIDMISLADELALYKMDIDRINKLIFEPLKDYLVYLPEVLKRNLIKYEINNKNSLHSIGGPILFINYYFKICDETINYLNQWEDAYNVGSFSDLTLYKDEKVIIIASSEDECLF